MQVDLASGRAKTVIMGAGRAVDWRYVQPNVLPRSRSAVSCVRLRSTLYNGGKIADTLQASLSDPQLTLEVQVGRMRTNRSRLDCWIAIG